MLRADTPAPDPNAPAPQATPTDASSLEARRAAAAQLSASDMQAKASTIMAQLPEDYRHVIYLKEQAKKGKDVLKLTCVNDKLVQMKAQMNIADSTNADLQAAIGSGTADGRVTFFVNLQDTAGTISQLRQDADVCAGTPELYKQEAGVTVEAPDLPDPGAGDPFGVEGGDVVEPPGYASPFN
jgi:hypothetical protein